MPRFHYPRPLSLPLAWLLVWLVVPGLAGAAGYGDGEDFSLWLASGETRWVYGDTPRETQLRRITASWSQPLSPSMRGRLNLAYLDTSQAEHPQAVGLTTAGDALGIELQFDLVDMPRFQLALRVGYDYARSDNALDGQQIENSWSTASLGLDAVLGLGRTVYLLAGAGQVSVDGEQQLSGDVNQITAFEEETADSYYAGLNIRTDNRGLIGLHWMGGYRAGVVLRFVREY